MHWAACSSRTTTPITSAATSRLVDRGIAELLALPASTRSCTCSPTKRPGSSASPDAPTPSRAACLGRVVGGWPAIPITLIHTPGQLRVRVLLRRRHLVKRRHALPRQLRTTTARGDPSLVRELTRNSLIVPERRSSIPGNYSADRDGDGDVRGRTSSTAAHADQWMMMLGGPDCRSLGSQLGSLAGIGLAGMPSWIERDVQGTRSPEREALDHASRPRGISAGSGAARGSREAARSSKRADDKH